MSTGADAGVRAEVAGLRDDIRALLGGLGLMLDTQETHTDTLRRILAALTAEPPDESPMQAMLARLAESVEASAAATERMRLALAAAALRGVRAPQAP